MSTELQEKEQMEMGTKPEPQHEWLQNLVGEWTSEMEGIGMDGEPMSGKGKESVKSLGGLWAFAEGHGAMPDGSEMTSYFALGWDVTAKGYRGCWLASMSSHLWKYEGELSADGKTMTLKCKGPSFVKDGEWADYKDVIELVDENYRTLTSYGQDENGEWKQFMKVHYRK